MDSPARPDVLVFVCANCIPEGQRLPRQWRQGDAWVQTREVPCSGKTDVQYLFNAFESGIRGLAVVTCPPGACHLAQGNYRAGVRIRTIKRLLAEIGLEPERAESLHCSPDDDLEATVRGVAERLCALGECALGTKAMAWQVGVNDQHINASTGPDRSRR